MIYKINSKKSMVKWSFRLFSTQEYGWNVKMEVMLHKAGSSSYPVVFQGLVLLIWRHELSTEICAYCFTIQKTAKSLGKIHRKQVTQWWELFLMREIFQMALIQILICYACLAPSNLTQAFPSCKRQSKLFCSLKKTLIFW